MTHEISVAEVSDSLPDLVPVLPLKSTVLFPQQVVSALLTSKQSVSLLSAQEGADQIVAAGVWLDPDGAYTRDNLGRVAVSCRVLDRVRMPEGAVRVVLQGLRRIQLTKIVRTRPFLQARAEFFSEPDPDSAEARELVAEVTRLVGQLVDVDEGYPEELVKAVRLNLASASRCADFVADRVQFSYADKKAVLDEVPIVARLALVAELLRRPIARAQVAGDVQAKTAVLLDRAQRKALLRAQLEVVRRELGELDPAENEIAELERKLRAVPLPPIAAEEAMRQVQHLRAAPVRALQGASIRAYVEWVTSLPWEARTKDRLDLRRARKVFDDRYFAFEEPKRRLLEFLAVRKLGGTSRTSLLAIVGPRGTGRGGLAQTVAGILGREFVRISLRGVGEDEILGRRGSTSGARPSVFLDAIRKSGTRNPVVLVEDWDLLEDDGGESMAALLEALDPARNQRFFDRYLGVPFDLSDVLFILTACVEDSLPEMLEDRMSHIDLPGYTEPEKVVVTQRNVWPELVREHGIEERGLSITDAALREVIRSYTREAGIQGLREQLEQVCRRIAVREASFGHRRLSINVRNLRDYLGAPVYRDDPRAREAKIGAAIGLAWTEDGGDLLPVEALLMPGDGRRTLTGLLGEVLQESVAAAISYVRSHASELGIASDVLEQNDLHVHFPEGAIEKDGPSAGIAVATAIASLLSDRPVRHDLAMTGEIQLRGRVLPVGGIREKILAAYRVGIKHVILPKGNECDVDEIPRDVRSKMRLHLVDDVAEVFKIALRARRKG